MSLFLFIFPLLSISCIYRSLYLCTSLYIMPFYSFFPSPTLFNIFVLSLSSHLSLTNSPFFAQLTFLCPTHLSLPNSPFVAQLTFRCLLPTLVSCPIGLYLNAINRHKRLPILRKLSAKKQQHNLTYASWLTKLSLSYIVPLDIYLKAEWKYERVECLDTGYRK